MKDFGMKPMRMPALVAFVLSVAILTSGALAQTPGTTDGSFLRDEFLVIGARTGLAFDQIGGDGLGDEFSTGSAKQEDEDEAEGPSHTGDKVKAGLFSAIIPGTGQFYNGQNQKGFIQFVV